MCAQLNSPLHDSLLTELASKITEHDIIDPDSLNRAKLDFLSGASSGLDAKEFRHYQRPLS